MKLLAVIPDSVYSYQCIQNRLLVTRVYWTEQTRLAAVPAPEAAVENTITTTEHEMVTETTKTTTKTTEKITIAKTKSKNATSEVKPVKKVNDRKSQPLPPPREKSSRIAALAGTVNMDFDDNIMPTKYSEYTTGNTFSQLQKDFHVVVHLEEARGPVAGLIIGKQHATQTFTVQLDNSDAEILRMVSASHLTLLDDIELSDCDESEGADEDYKE
jgi:hypothetical protein